MEENILFMFDSGLDIDRICCDLNINEHEVFKALIKNKRIKRTYKHK